MAVTKTHPIKSTLKAAIDYILNPEKTDGKLLASSFGCGLETADIEFAWTREAAGDRGTHLGRHLIQSFAVGETTPEEAHKIGMELAGAVLGGKYEFVLTTHVDKDHLHNHLIFNAVSFVDYKKYHSNKQSYHFIRRTSAVITAYETSATGCVGKMDCPSLFRVKAAREKAMQNTPPKSKGQATKQS